MNVSSKKSMKPNPKFQNLPKSFWAIVRSLGQTIGYTQRGAGKVKVPTVEEASVGYGKLRLDKSQLVAEDNSPTETSNLLNEYFEYRAAVLNNFVESRLMDANRAKKEFDKLQTQLKPTCPIPMNKQKGAKRAPAYLTAIVNMIIEHESNGMPCDYDPRELTTITRDGEPLRTLARRVDGAFPSPINPIAIWEIKEYYYTTTFGSRVADGVYETLLDGMELEELRNSEGINVKHYLMLDAHYTWWDCGKSYLCRILDMLHMGYIDEVLFGYEVIEDLPRIVNEWIRIKKEKRYHFDEPLFPRQQ